MNQRIILILAGLSGALAVGLGAFGAHALKVMLEANGRVNTFEMAVRYHFFHTLALLAAGILTEKFPATKYAALLFSLGTLIFCGSLYALAFTNQPWWGAITPLGGVALIGGWLSLGWCVYKNHKG